MRYSDAELRRIRARYGFTPGIAFVGAGGTEPLCWVTEDGADQKTLTTYTGWS